MKSGSKFKMNSDKIIYAIIIIILVVFMFNMKRVYKFISELKTGEMFRKTPVVDNGNDNNKQNENNNTQNNNKDNNTYEIVNPVGNNSVNCQYTSTKENGEKVTKVTLYYTGNDLKSIVENISYSSSDEEYFNVIASEKTKYDKRKTNNIKLKGYSIEITSGGSTSLKVRSVYDLSKISFLDVKTIEEDTIILYGSFNANINEVKEEYQNNGFNCGVR